MRISINLASRPFIELRPLFARLRLAMAGLAVLAIGLAVTAHRMSVKGEAAGAAMGTLVSQTNAVQGKTAQNEARMKRPENQGVLARSRFLNGIFAAKSFSWTGTMMDLEHVLPQGVQVTSIDPVIAKDGTVTIRLRVTGERERTIELVRNLERSQRFIAPRLAGESALTADKAKAFGAGGASLQNVSDPMGGGVEFEIFSGYNPLSDSLTTGTKDQGPESKSSKVSAPHKGGAR